jgi:hypothetical protein
MTQTFFAVFPNLGVGTTSHVFEDGLRFARSDSSKGVRALSLKLMEVVPPDELGEWDAHGLRDRWNGSWVADKPEFKYYVFMAVVPLFDQQFQQDWNPRSTFFWDGVQRVDDVGNVLRCRHRVLAELPLVAGGSPIQVKA